MPRLWVVLSLEQGKSRQMQPQGLGENGRPGQREDVRQEKHIISTRLQKEGSVSDSIKMRACQKLRHIYNSPVSPVEKGGQGFCIKSLNRALILQSPLRDLSGGQARKTSLQQAPQ